MQSQSAKLDTFKSEGDLNLSPARASWSAEHIDAVTRHWLDKDVPAPDYWKRIRAACDKHGVLLILDEIPLCLGRTGRMFACEHYDVVPNMLVIGKGLGGGIFPMAALIAREDLNMMSDWALGH